MPPDHAAILARAPLFQAMGVEITRAIIQNRSPRHYERGERVFQQGDPAESFFLVIEGWVKILSRKRENGEQIVVSIFTAGETFGEAAMFMGGRYPLQPKRSLPRAFCVSMARRYVGPFCKTLSSLSTCSRLFPSISNSWWSRSSSSRRNPRHNGSPIFCSIRSATFQQARIALPYEKALIANRLGMQPESFSRALVKLREMGVTVARDNVLIKDVGKLAEFASRSSADIG